MLNPKIEKLLNEQIVKEVYSAHLYLSMSAWLSDKNLDGYAKWFYVQYSEELDHALIIFNYVINAGGKAQIGAIEAPQSDFKDVREILAASLEHEEYVTQSIYDIVKEATDEKDYKTVQFLDWFIEEQVEEEDEASNNLGRFDIMGGDCNGLYSLDRDMGTRTYTKTARLAELEDA